MQRTQERTWAPLAALLALAVALLVALSPAAAWAEDEETTETTTETPYANDTVNTESLPTAPTVDGTIWYVTPDNVQYALDGAYGSIDGVTIVLTEGTYGTLYIGRATKYSGSNTKHKVWSSGSWSDTWYSATEETDALSSTVQIYKRTVNNLTITAEDGVTVAGVEITDYTARKSGYNYVLDEEIGGTNSVTTEIYQVVEISGLTISGLDISGGQIDIKVNQYSGSSLSGVTIKDCTFTGDTSSMSSSSYAAIRILGGSSVNVSGVTITGCVIQDYFQGMYVSNTTGTVTIANNYICNTTHNAIALQGYANGTYDIEENVIEGAGDRAIRFGTASGATSITVTNNIILDSGDDDDQNFKADSLPSDTSAVSLEYNYWDGDDASTAVSNTDYVPTYTGINGGTFDEDVITGVEAYYYTGYVTLDNGDGTWTVILEPTKVDAVAATCTETGNVEYYYATDDDGTTTYYTATTTTATDDDGVETTTTTYTSTTLAAVTIAATGHTAGEAVVENEADATCTTDGSYDEVVYCTVCGAEISRETVTISATGHTWNYENASITIEWADDYSSATATFVCINDSSHTATVTASSVTATDNGDGTVTYTATFTDPDGEEFERYVTVEAEDEATTADSTDSSDDESELASTGDSTALVTGSIAGMGALALAAGLAARKRRNAA